jgi:hypothetical protein
MCISEGTDDMDATLDQSSPRSMRESFGDFFYSQETPYGIALMRIALPSVLLFVVVPRWFHARELFSSDGATASLATNYGAFDFPPEPSGAVAVALMTLLILTLISSSIGWYTRVSLVISFSLYTYLNLLDCLSTLTKYSVISSHLLLLLALSPCGSVWSMDRWTSKEKLRPRFHIWPRRLMQLLIGLIYLGAATTKLHTNTYFTSDQLRYWMMTDVNNNNPAGEILSFYPELLILMANVAILWQLVFVFVVWQPRVRVVALGMGAFFHLTTTPTLGLYIFPFVMLSSYLCFLSEHDVRRARIFVRKQLRKSEFFVQFRSRLKILRLSRSPRPVPQTLTTVASQGRIVWLRSFYVWGAILLGSTVAGVAAEYSLDPYQRRGSGGPLRLRQADPTLVARLSEPLTPIAEDDLILSMDVGRSTLGGVLFDLHETFQRGEHFLVQVSLTDPHPDLWLECNLLDTSGVTIHRAQQIVPREQLRATWDYSLPDSLPAGTYTLKLRTANGELGTKRVTITR